MSDHPASDRDQGTVARLTGAAQRHASWPAPTREEMSAAVAELRDLADSRADLLAEVAGLLIGYYRGTAEEAKARTAARYCRAAGADPDLVPRWIEEGERRATHARQHPYAGYLAS
jgi:acyl-CoA reductase-like NAD-dependent aldehyde dehydrogenase